MVYGVDKQTTNGLSEDLQSVISTYPSVILDLLRRRGRQRGHDPSVSINDACGDGQAQPQASQPDGGLLPQSPFDRLSWQLHLSFGTKAAEVGLVLDLFLREACFWIVEILIIS